MQDDLANVRSARGAKGRWFKSSRRRKRGNDGLRDITSLRHIKQSGVATPNAGTTGADLCQDPGAYYVNYHTTVFPLGAIRGQLH